MDVNGHCHRMDGAERAPETGRAGPGTAVGAPGGTDAPDTGSGATAGRVSPCGPPVPTGADGAGDPGAARVWAQLLQARDPVSADTLASAAGVPGATARAALLVFEQAGYVLRIPGQAGRFPYPDLWVLAGGVREGRSVADAVRSGLLDQGPGLDPGNSAPGTGVDHTGPGSGGRGAGGSGDR